MANNTTCITYLISFKYKVQTAERLAFGCPARRNPSILEHRFPGLSHQSAAADEGSAILTLPGLLFRAAPAAHVSPPVTLITAKCSPFWASWT